jgi:hypothetical protein
MMLVFTQDFCSGCRGSIDPAGAAARVASGQSEAEERVYLCAR